MVPLEFLLKFMPNFYIVLYYSSITHNLFLSPSPSPSPRSPSLSPCFFLPLLLPPSPPPPIPSSTHSLSPHLCIGAVLYAAENATQVALDAIQCLGEWVICMSTCHPTIASKCAVYESRIVNKVQGERRGPACVLVPNKRIVPHPNHLAK